MNTTPRLILLVGPSASGKTTVGRQLADDLNLLFISMDDFRVKGRHTYPMAEHNGQRLRNYEHPDCWDGHAIACKLRACIASGMGFVAEGNHLLHYPGIAGLADTERYYLDVPHAVSVARRKTRHRGGPADESFALIGEVETAKWVAPQKTLPGVRVIDGTLPVEEIVSAVMHGEPAPAA